MRAGVSLASLCVQYLPSQMPLFSIMQTTDCEDTSRIKTERKTLHLYVLLWFSSLDQCVHDVVWMTYWAEQPGERRDTLE